MVVRPEDFMPSCIEDQAKINKIVAEVESVLTANIKSQYGDNWRGQAISIPTKLFGDDPHLAEQAINVFADSGWYVIRGQRRGGMDDRHESWYEFSPQ